MTNSNSEERRVDSARELGRLSAVVESLQRTQTQTREEFMDVFKEMRDSIHETNSLLSKHVNDDNRVAAKVESLEEWRDGKNGKDGADDKINYLLIQRAKFLAVIAVLSIVGSAAGANAGAIIKALSGH